MQRNIIELKQSLRCDVYIIAAGKSLDYVPTDFLANKMTLGINQAYKKVGCDCLLVRDRMFFDEVYQAAAQTGSTLLAAREGFWHPHKREPNVPTHDTGYPYHTFECNWHTKKCGLDLDVIGTDELVAGMSTLHTAMHAAAYLGATNIILCGADGGLLDGEKYFNGYRADSPNVTEEQFVPWLSEVEGQTILLRKALQAVYNCNVVSLNPFVNFALEGHEYEHA